MADPAIDKRNEIVEKNTRLAERLAQIWADKHGPTISSDDLLGPANLGLVKAATDYDASKSDSFTNYARIRITGEIKDHLRYNDHLSRLDREIIREYESLEGTVEERAEQMGLSAEQVAHLMTIPADLKNEFRNDAPGIKFKQNIHVWDEPRASLDSNTSESYPFDELENVVEVCCQFLSQKTAYCFRLRHLHGKDYKEIGIAAGISKTCAFTRIKSAYKLLSKEPSLRNKLGLEPGETSVTAF